jgi:ABC-type nickel/cobalt efflux system permease component RcnA
MVDLVTRVTDTYASSSSDIDAHMYPPPHIFVQVIMVDLATPVTSDKGEYQTPTFRLIGMHVSSSSYDMHVSSSSYVTSDAGKHRTPTFHLIDVCVSVCLCVNVCKYTRNTHTHTHTHTHTRTNTHAHAHTHTQEPSLAGTCRLRARAVTPRAVRQQGTLSICAPIYVYRYAGSLDGL